MPCHAAGASLLKTAPSSVRAICQTRPRPSGHLARVDLAQGPARRRARVRVLAFLARFGVEAGEQLAGVDDLQAARVLFQQHVGRARLLLQRLAFAVAIDRLHVERRLDRGLRLQARERGLEVGDAVCMGGRARQGQERGAQRLGACVLQGCHRKCHGEWRGRITARGPPRWDGAVAPRGQRGVMRDQHQRRPALAVELEHQFDDGVAGGRSRLPVARRRTAAAARCTKARASATRCCSPPDTVFG